MKRKPLLYLQGRVVRLYRPGSCETERGNKRGAIEGFSRASRLRMLEFVGKSRMPEVGEPQGLFMTLTYPDNETASRVKRDLDVFGKSWRRRYPEHAFLWRMEAQERGAWHLHLLTLTLHWADLEWLRQTWERVIGWEGAHHVHLDVTPMQSARMAAYYAAKYCAKVTKFNGRRASGEAAGAPAVRLVNDAYLTGESVGRVWGVVNRARWPMSEGGTLPMTGEGAVRMARLLRRKLRGRRGSMVFAFAAEWYRAWVWCETGKRIAPELVKEWYKGLDTIVPEGYNEGIPEGERKSYDEGADTNPLEAQGDSFSASTAAT